MIQKMIILGNQRMKIRIMLKNKKKIMNVVRYIFHVIRGCRIKSTKEKKSKTKRWLILKIMKNN